MTPRDHRFYATVPFFKLEIWCFRIVVRMQRAKDRTVKSRLLATSWPFSSFGYDIEKPVMMQIIHAKNIW